MSMIVLLLQDIGHLYFVPVYWYSIVLTICLSLCQVIEMPEHNPGQLGGTMRLGRRRTVFSNDYESITSKLFPRISDGVTGL